MNRLGIASGIDRHVDVQPFQGTRDVRVRNRGEFTARRHGQPLRRARAHADLSAGQPGDLRRQQADDSGPEHQHGLTRLQGRPSDALHCNDAQLGHCRVLGRKHHGHTKHLLVGAQDDTRVRPSLATSSPTWNLDPGPARTTRPDWQ
jgi:hypothetical protein